MLGPRGSRTDGHPLTLVLSFAHSSLRPLGLAAAFALLPFVSRADDAPKTTVWKLADPAHVGGKTTEVLGAPRVVDGAAVFDGAHDGVFVPDIPIAGCKQFTIEVLFSPAEGGGEAQRFVHLEDTSNHRALIEIRLDGKGSWWLDTFMMTDSQSGHGLTLIEPKNTHPTDKWYWAALRYDGTTGTMTDFVNGQQELQGKQAFMPYVQGKISLGVRQNKVYWFKGAIKEVRFTPVALDADKLQRVK